MLKPQVLGFDSNPYSFEQDAPMMEVPDSFANSTLMASHNPSLYLIKDLPPPAEVSGSLNLLSQYGLESTYNKFSGKKLKETLSSFLPEVPGVSDLPGTNDGSTFRALIEKPPIVGSKEIQPLSNNVLMAAFRLHPGPLPEKDRPLYLQNDNRKRHKHHKNKSRPDPSVLDSRAPDLEEGKKHKKRKHDDGEKKKRKKEKKKKKEKEKERF